MALFYRCQICSELTPFSMDGKHCMDCANVTWDEYLVALELLGGHRTRNLWCPGIDELALALSKARLALGNYYGE